MQRRHRSAQGRAEQAKSLTMGDIVRTVIAVLFAGPSLYFLVGGLYDLRNGGSDPYSRASALLGLALGVGGLLIALVIKFGGGPSRGISRGVVMLLVAAAMVATAYDFFHQG